MLLAGRGGSAEALLAPARASSDAPCSPAEAGPALGSGTGGGGFAHR